MSDTTGTVTTAERAEQGAVPSVPARLAAVFLPAPLPRDGRIAFWDPEGGPVAGAAPEDGARPTEAPAAGAAAGAPEPTQLTVVR
ncbi:hypothetical protein, partial [Streptomyces solaniscabiei]